MDLNSPYPLVHTSTKEEARKATFFCGGGAGKPDYQFVKRDQVTGAAAVTAKTTGTQGGHIRAQTFVE